MPVKLAGRDGVRAINSSVLEDMATKLRNAADSMDFIREAYMDGDENTSKHCMVAFNIEVSMTSMGLLQSVNLATANVDTLKTCIESAKKAETPEEMFENIAEVSGLDTDTEEYREAIEEYKEAEKGFLEVLEGA